MKLVRIEGSKDLVKDEETGAVLNSNETEIEAAKIRKEQRHALLQAGAKLK